MKLLNKKHSNRWIKVLSNKNKILTKKGFATITATSEYVDQTIRADILEKNYIIPDNVQIQD